MPEIFIPAKARSFSPTPEAPARPERGPSGSAQADFARTLDRQLESRRSSAPARPPAGPSASAAPPPAARPPTREAGASRDKAAQAEGAGPESAARGVAHRLLPDGSPAGVASAASR